MNVLFVSQCDKRALTETRRVLDQFAERRGTRTWQTPITQAGLDTVRRMLKRTARKNTAVACHWIRGLDHSELVWVVGNARGYNEQGAVPTNATEGDVLRSEAENDWHTAQDITFLSVLGSLFHDFGKANRGFQAKLKTRASTADAYRHEWVSLRLFEAFVAGCATDEEWLTRLAAVDRGATALVLERVDRDGLGTTSMSPFRSNRMPPLAQAVAWLIVTHHRLPRRCDGGVGAAALRHLLAPVDPSWNDARSAASASEIEACWDFPNGLPFDSSDWCERTRRCAAAVLTRPGLLQSGARLLDDPYIMHISRLALMLADHYYSSGPSLPQYGDVEFPLHANTDHATGQLKQRLDEHLVGVASHARRILRTLPRLDRDLPRIARCKAFQRRSRDDRFRWQDHAYDLAGSLREASAIHGFFGVNMASTGCGKTLANGRILYALANPRRGARFTVALGLRTLTLQTGAAYRDRLRLGDDDLAVLVGGGAVRELFELGAESRAASTGSESTEGLLPDDSHVHFEGSLEDGPLKRWLGANPDAHKLLQAPVLACTIDHLVPATESLRGGRQIGPMLRLLTSDLVLDEPDDFDLGDLPALSRMVHWAGLLGSRVLLSSATLPPAIVEGLYAAYRAGRDAFQRNRGIPGAPLAIPCAWFDEFRCESYAPQDQEAFHAAHRAFVDRRLTALRRVEPRRAVQIVPVVSPKPDPESVSHEIASRLPDWIAELHAHHHASDPTTGKRISFGLVRMANINPLISVAEELIAQGAPNQVRFHLCVYHARYPLLVRSAIERQLDAVLQRSDPLLVFEQQSVRDALDRFPEPQHVFVVLASPVAEVGRDHDYDWAIVEPSSVRSIVQLAGRVRRHRPGGVAHPNLLLLNRNLRALRMGPLAYCRPGFEDQQHILKTHDLQDLIEPEQLDPLDAAPRIRERDPLDANGNLADLEHQQLRELMLAEGASSTAFTVPDWWRTRAHLIGQLQHSQRFRKGPPDLTFALLPRAEDDEEISFFRRDDDWIRVDSLLDWCQLEHGPRVTPWGTADYGAMLTELAEQLEREPLSCAERYGTVQLMDSVHGWRYHPWLGFKRLS